jgi:cellulose synthase/poly-beta-1,6-N-acetylglucosamine synthase-like glycosyltransferase/peptidoglycan/xylan/chitin deacetylase (PgdA/CDA1 family)
MPIFLDTSKRRKWYFRGTAVLVVFFVLACVLVFAFGLAFSNAAHKPVSYNDAVERYHYYYSAANEKKIALTVDDGPHPPASQKFWDTLTLYHAPATFFYIGDKALLRPDLVEQAAKLGFDVQSHSFTHGQGVDSSYNRLAFELNTTGYLLSQITGQEPKLYRPPYLLGIGIDPTINPYIPLPKDMLWALELGYLPVGSDVDPHDWLATSTQGIVSNLADALKKVPNGHIVLLHEDPLTAKALPSIITYLRMQGYTIVPVEQLLTPPTEVALAGTLKPGDTDQTTGGDVSKLQWFLYKQGYLDPYGLSGVFDVPTKNALTNFQISNNIVDPANPDPSTIGVAGPATRSLIEVLSRTYEKTSPTLASQESGFHQAQGVAFEFLRDGYILLFPKLHMFLVGVIFASLILVICRSLGLLILLALNKRRERTLEGRTYAELPGISVMIPAYNEEQNIGATVESIIASRYKKKEIIVIDDGSKDNTSDEVRAVIDAHPNEAIQLIQVQNGGKARALNIGLEHAHNSIVVVLDADAVLDTNALGHFAKHFDDPSIGAVAGRVRTTGNLRALDLFQTLEYAIGQNIDKRAFSTLGAVGVVPGPAGAWRRLALVEVGGFSTDTLVEDQDMTLTLLRAGKKVIYEPDAIAYTETPHTIKNFLKQRFRWVYGTMQCFWKHKHVVVERPGSAMSLIVIPNIFIFNILLPLAYPFADSALLFGLIFGQWQTLVLPFVAFTTFDILYSLCGVWNEPSAWRLMVAVPLQRVVYRQLLYYTVMRGVVRAVEGTGSTWNKFAKVGETRRFYLSSLRAPAPSLLSLRLPFSTQMFATLSPLAAVATQIQSQLMPEEVMMSFQGPSGTSEPSTNFQEVVALSVIPRHLQSAGETSSPAWAPNVLTGVFDEPNTYAKSSSPFGPTSSH